VDVHDKGKALSSRRSTTGEKQAGADTPVPWSMTTSLVATPWLAAASSNAATNVLYVQEPRS
jgi:hypothetical protein